MEARSISETQRVRYLLGLSSPEEREHIESEYFEDEDAFQEMLTAEDDLIDAYARGELVGEERRRFEKNFGSSFPGRDRVQFARAFAGVMPATRSVRNGTLLNLSKTFQSPRLFQTATITTIMVLVVALAWLVNDRRRITNELRELRAESAELSKRTEALHRSIDNQQTRTAEIATQRTNLSTESEKPRHRYSPVVKNDREQIANSKPAQAEKLINTEDVTLGNTFERQTITELPLNANNVVDLLSLHPALPRDRYLAASRTDQAGMRLDGIDVEAPLNTYLLKPPHTSYSDETIFIPNSLRWIRFQTALETSAIHDNYRVTIKTADGHSVTSVDWIEPLTPNQTIIDTPAITTGDLPSGDYVLLLTAKEPDGSFVKVAEYSFKIIRY